MVESNTVELILADAEATERCGAALAAVCRGAVIYLEGDLGAGKTTFSRGLLRELGVTGAVKSPTFSIVEVYALTDGSVFHLDLYRLRDPEEVNYLGVADQLGEKDVLLVEWAGHGKGALPRADLEIRLLHHGEQRRLESEAHSMRGAAMLRKLQQLIP